MVPPEDDKAATGPKLKVTETASAPPGFDPDRRTATTEKDERGRVFTIRKLNAMHKLDLSQILGAEGVHNDGVVGPCSMAWSVTHIDGEQVYPPRTYEELRALVGRLDDDGIAAIEAAIIANFGVQGAPDKDAVKNS